MPHILVVRGAGDFFQCRADPLLHPMVGLDIAGGIGPLAAGEADEARMLAGAIVVQGAVGLAPLAASARLAASPIGQWVPHSRQADIPPRLGQHGLGHRHMAGSPGMGGAGERDLLVGQARNCSAMPLSTSGKA